MNINKITKDSQISVSIPINISDDDRELFAAELKNKLNELFYVKSKIVRLHYASLINHALMRVFSSVNGIKFTLKIVDNHLIVNTEQYDDDLSAYLIQ